MAQGLFLPLPWSGEVSNKKEEALLGKAQMLSNCAYSHAQQEMRAVRYRSPLVGLPLASSAQREEDTLVLQLWKNLSGQQDVSRVTLELILPHLMGPLEKNQLAGSGAEFWI